MTTLIVLTVTAIVLCKLFPVTETPTKTEAGVIATLFGISG